MRTSEIKTTKMNKKLIVITETGIAVRYIEGESAGASEKVPSDSPRTRAQDGNHTALQDDRRSEHAGNGAKKTETGKCAGTGA